MTRVLDLWRQLMMDERTDELPIKGVLGHGDLALARPVTVYEAEGGIVYVALPTDEGYRVFSMSHQLASAFAVDLMYAAKGAAFNDRGRYSSGWDSQELAQRPPTPL